MIFDVNTLINVIDGGGHSDSQWVDGGLHRSRNFLDGDVVLTYEERWSRGRNNRVVGFYVDNVDDRW